MADLVADCGARVYPVGRLDLDSEGLLLLTNDGALMQHLLHPRHQVDKTYHVTVFGDVRDAAARLAAVTDLEGEPICPARVELLHQSWKSPSTREKTGRSGGCAPSAAGRSSGCGGSGSIPWSWEICLPGRGAS